VVFALARRATGRAQAEPDEELAAHPLEVAAR